MQTVNIHDAKTNLSKLIAAAVAGEPFIIAKAGKPLVKVTAIEPTDAPKKRRIGFMAGMFTVPDDIKAFGREEIEEMFYGNPDKFKMKLLLDTQLLIWATNLPERLPDKARVLIEKGSNEILFSVVSIWEVAIKFALRSPDFDIDPAALRQHLVANGYIELDMTSLHAIEVATLPILHRDPFDRLLISQSNVEHAALLTTDKAIARYPGSIIRV